MIDSNHLFTLHHKYTGDGCAMCGKSSVEHSKELWMVGGKQIKPDEIETVRPVPQPRPKSLIEELMDEAGITKEFPEFGLQFNLTYASLSDFGIRCGLDQRIKDVMKKRGLGKMTEKGRIEFIELIMRCLAMLGCSKEEIVGDTC